MSGRSILIGFADDTTALVVIAKKSRKFGGQRKLGRCRRLELAYEKKIKARR